MGFPYYPWAQTLSAKMAQIVTRIKANKPLHFELHLQYNVHLWCITINRELISKTSLKPTYATGKTGKRDKASYC